jgi:uncharacterized protein YPO0396
VGELIEVKPDEVEWQGAIERVLHGFALSLLVDEGHYSALTNHINNTHLGRRLVYYRTGRSETWQAKPIAVNSLALKLNVKEGAYSEWLQFELRQRFDYACVDSLQLFRSSDRAITREGQVKHSKNRHEKDDRRSVEDRRNWVLGFDNREKLMIFQTQAQELAATISRITGEINALADQDKNRATRAMQCQTLVNLRWQEIDIAPVLERIATLEDQIREAQAGNTTLLQISEQIEEQKKLLEQADKVLRGAIVAHDVVLRQIKDNSKKLESLIQDTARVPLNPSQITGLNQRFAAQSWRDYT